MQITDVSSYARLALAAYAQYSDNSTVYEGSLKAAGFGTNETVDFTTHQTVMAHIDDTSSGLSATLFKDASGKFSIAVRGTDPSLLDILADTFILAGVPSSLNPQFVALTAWVDGLLAAATEATETTPATSAGLLFGSTFTVTGHSLGGYLAAAVKSVYAAATEAYLYNAPGTSSVVGTFFQQAFGVAAPGVQNVWNIHSSEGPSFISGLGQQVSAPLIQQIETTNNFGADHSIKSLSLGLMVSEAYMKAMPSLTYDDVNACIDAFGRTSAAAFEEAVTFLAQAITGAPPATPMAIGNRDDLFNAIKDINALPPSGATCKVLAGLNADALYAAVAQDNAEGSASRFAMEALSPIAIVGGANPGAPSFADHSTDYWFARSELLQRKVWFSTKDLASVTASVPTAAEGTTLDTFQTEARYFDDQVNQYKIAQGGPFPGEQRIIFGSNSGATLEGAGIGDKLFGGTGNDTLKGYYGADLLDGGGGSDVLDGGLGADTLIGGAGIDWLGYTAAAVGSESQDEINSDGNSYDGGTGCDFIAGSVNKDTFIFRKGDGFDTIVTHGGGDELQLKATHQSPSGATVVDIEESAVSFTREGLNLLVNITSADGTVDHVRIASWFDNGAGANVLGSVTLGTKTWTTQEITSAALHIEGPNDPTIGDTITGVAGYADVINGNAGDDFIDVSQSSTVLASDVVHGGAGNDQILGGTSSDFLYGDANNDSISGGGGNDTFVGGTGNDTLTGGAGADTYIYSRGDGQDIIVEQPDQVGIQDKLQFTGIRLDEAAFNRVGNDLRVSFSDGGSVSVGGWFTKGAKSQIETVSFLDQSLTAAEVTARIGVVLTEGPDVYNGTAGADVVYGLGGNDVLNGAAGNDVLNGGDGNDTLDGGVGADILRGGAGDDIMGGTLGSPSYDSGVNGSLTFQPGALGNTYEGGTGNDTLRGTVMADLYLFNSGDGMDTINEIAHASAPAGQLDVVRFGAGINPADITVTHSGTWNSDLVLKFANGTDQITIPNWYDAASYRVERFEFADGPDGSVGTVWTVDDITSKGLVMTGTPGNDGLVGLNGYSNTLNGMAGNDNLIGGNLTDTLNGGDGSDTLTGNAGDDVLNGGDGNDTLDGSVGADILRGGAGDDILGGTSWTTSLDSGAPNGNYVAGSLGNTYEGGTGKDVLNGTVMADLYLFNSGDGMDTINEIAHASAPAGQLDVVRFGAGINPADITVTHSGTWNSDLVLKFANGTDQITIPNWYDAASYRVERFEFADGPDGSVGTVWTADDMTSKGLVMTGTPGNNGLVGLNGYSNTLNGMAGNDNLIGGNLADTLYGGAGNDLLQGGSGNDAYLYAAGDGYDTINDAQGAADTLQMTGVDVSATAFWRQGNDLVVVMGDTGAGVLVKNQFLAGDANRIENFSFDGASFSAAYIASIAQLRVAPMSSLSALSFTAMPDAPQGAITAADGTLALALNPDVPRNHDIFAPTTQLVMGMLAPAPDASSQLPVDWFATPKMVLVSPIVDPALFDLAAWKPLTMFIGNQVEVPAWDLTAQPAPVATLDMPFSDPAVAAAIAALQHDMSTGMGFEYGADPRAFDTKLQTMPFSTDTFSFGSLPVTSSYLPTTGVADRKLDAFALMTL